MSGCAQWMQHPQMLILYFRGRFENSWLLVKPRLISSICGVASMNFVRIDARDRAARHVARDVAARAAGDDADLLKCSKIVGISSMRSQ